ncbi:DUF2326 domain-containing protein [Streptomyces sp. NPDC054802]
MAAEIAEEEGMQYIVSLNSDDLSKAVQRGFSVEDRVIEPRLTDESEEGVSSVFASEVIRPGGALPPCVMLWRFSEREGEMTEKPVTHKQALAAVIQALGGTWDTERAVLALRVAGYRPADDEAAGKEARRNLRELAQDGVIVRPDPGQAVYRPA